jgi:hypothetical protein
MSETTQREERERRERERWRERWRREREIKDLLRERERTPHTRTYNTRTHTHTHVCTHARTYTHTPRWGTLFQSLAMCTMWWVAMCTMWWVQWTRLNPNPSTETLNSGPHTCGASLQVIVLWSEALGFVLFFFFGFGWVGFLCGSLALRL